MIIHQFPADQDERLLALHDGILDCAKLVAARPVTWALQTPWDTGDPQAVDGYYWAYYIGYMVNLLS